MPDKDKKPKIMGYFDLMNAEIRAQELGEGHYSMREAIELIMQLVESNRALLHQKARKGSRG